MEASRSRDRPTTGSHAKTTAAREEVLRTRTLIAIQESSGTYRGEACRDTAQEYMEMRNCRLLGCAQTTSAFLQPSTPRSWDEQVNAVIPRARFTKLLTSIEPSATTLPRSLGRYW